MNSSPEGPLRSLGEGYSIPNFLLIGKGTTRISHGKIWDDVGSNVGTVYLPTLTLLQKLLIFTLTLLQELKSTSFFLCFNNPSIEKSGEIFYCISLC